MLKKLFILFLIIPSLTFSQTSSWRTSPPSSNSTTNSSSKTAPAVENNVSGWRNSSPVEFNKPRVNSVIVRAPWVGGWNRWNPPLFGWNSYNPYWYWNDFGYRQPARIYYYGNGRVDTIKGKKPIYNFGISHTTDSQMGAFFAVGNKAYFIFDFNTTYKRDRSTFFPYGTLALADFPIIGERVKQNSFNFGIGRRFSRTGVHMMVGAAKERVLYLGKDAVGEITFPKFTQNFVTFKFGVLHDYKGLTLKLDHDPVVRYVQFGVGVNF